MSDSIMFSLKTKDILFQLCKTKKTEKYYPQRICRPLKSGFKWAFSRIFSINSSKLKMIKGSLTWKNQPVIYWCVFHWKIWKIRVSHGLMRHLGAVMKCLASWCCLEAWWCLVRVATTGALRWPQMTQWALSDASFTLFVQLLYEIKRFLWHADTDETQRTWDV